MIDNNVIFAGFSGSIRKDSFNTRLLNNLEDLLPEGVLLNKLSIEDIPLYNGDLDLPAADKRPKAVQSFREQLGLADALIIVSPEYNYGIPGVLKNAIDWASRGKDSPLSNMPVALMGVTQGMWGTTRMQQDFLPIFQYMDMQPVYKPEVYVSDAKSKFDEKGRFTDKEGKKLIQEKLEKLKAMVLQENVQTIAQ